MSQDPDRGGKTLSSSTGLNLRNLPAFTSGDELADVFSTGGTPYSRV
jgi:hypothetical protein